MERELKVISHWPEISARSRALSEKNQLPNPVNLIGATYDT